MILQAVFEYLDPGESGENVVLYNSRKAKEDEIRETNAHNNAIIYTNTSEATKKFWCSPPSLFV